MHALVANDLTKIFLRKKRLFSKSKEYKAVNAINFSIMPGESVAFLGRNGAGKSTTIKLLCGILTPTKGKSLIFSKESGTKEANSNIGIIFGTRSHLWMHLTIKQSLDITAEIYNVKGKEKLRKIAELAELFEINNFLDQRARTLSLGQRMRCELVAALIHAPRILLADEPTIGLDIVAKNQFRELISRWQTEKKSTLLLTSHDCSDVEALCQRSILIENGEIKYDGALVDLKGELKNIRRLIITLSDKVEQAITISDDRIKTKSIENYTLKYEINIKQISVAEAIRKLLIFFDTKVVDIQIQTISLEEVMHNLFVVNDT